MARGDVLIVLQCPHSLDSYSVYMGSESGPIWVDIYITLSRRAVQGGMGRGEFLGRVSAVQIATILFYGHLRSLQKITVL